MTDTAIISEIMTYLPDEHDFQRMKSLNCKNVDTILSFQDFLAWNEKCIKEISQDQRNWVLGLCQKIKKYKISLMDLESCSIFDAFIIYYCQNKILCIANPR
jgi:phosphoserine aminotransferase